MNFVYGGIIRWIDFLKSSPFESEGVQQSTTLQNTTQAVAFNGLEALPALFSQSPLVLRMVPVAKFLPTCFWQGALFIYVHGDLYIIENSPKTFEEFIAVFDKIAACPQLLVSMQFDRRFLDLVAAYPTHPHAAMAVISFLKLVEANQVQRYQNTLFPLSWGSVLQELDQRLSTQIPTFSPLLAAVLQSPLFQSKPGVDTYTALRGTHTIDGINSTLAETVRMLLIDAPIPRPEHFLTYISLTIVHKNFRFPLPLNVCVNLLNAAVEMAHDDWYLDFIHRVMRINLIPLRDPSLQPTLNAREIEFYLDWLNRFKKNGGRSDLIFTVCLSLAPITNFSDLWEAMILLIEINLRDYKLLVHLIMDVIRYHPEVMLFSGHILKFLIDNIRLSEDEADIFSAASIILHYTSREIFIQTLQKFSSIPYKSEWTFLDETVDPTDVANRLNLMLSTALEQPICSYYSPNSGSDMILFNALIKKKVFPFKLHSNAKFMAFQSNALLKHLLGRLPAADFENLPDNVNVLYVQSNVRQIFLAVPLLFNSKLKDADETLRQFIYTAKKFRCVPEACVQFAELKERNLLPPAFLNYEEQLKDDTADYDEEQLADTVDSDFE